MTATGLLVRQWLVERLEQEAVRHLPDALGDNVVLLRRFHVKNTRALAPQQGWIVVRAVKHKQRVKYEAEPWWEGLRGGEKTRPQATADKAAEQGYLLLERLWQREFDFAPRVVHLRSEHLR